MFDNAATAVAKMPEIVARSFIATDGHKRWLVLRWEGTPKGDLEVRERWPLHMDKAVVAWRDQCMREAGKRLHAKMTKLAGMERTN